MDELDWMEFRAKAARYEQERNRKLIEVWCKECGVTTPVGYENDHDGVMTIYTDKPGLLIGRGGEKVNKFHKALKREFNRDYKVKLVEIRGGFANLNIEEVM